MFHIILLALIVNHVVKGLNIVNNVLLMLKKVNVLNARKDSRYLMIKNLV